MAGAPKQNLRTESNDGRIKRITISRQRPGFSQVASVGPGRLTSEGSLVRTQLRPPFKQPAGMRWRRASFRWSVVGGSPRRVVYPWVTYRLLACGDEQRGSVTAVSDLSPLRDHLCYRTAARGLATADRGSRLVRS